MASGYVFQDDYPGGAAVCLPGSTTKLACESAGGTYWDFSGTMVCSIGATTKDAVESSVCDTANNSAAIIKPLNNESAEVLFAAVLAVVGTAYIFRLAINLMLNRG